MYAAPDLGALVADVVGDDAGVDASVAFAAIVVAAIDVDVDVAIARPISCNITFTGIRSLLPWTRAS